MTAEQTFKDREYKIPKEEAAFFYYGPAHDCDFPLHKYNYLYDALPGTIHHWGFQYYKDEAIRTEVYLNTLKKNYEDTHGKFVFSEDKDKNLWIFTFVTGEIIYYYYNFTFTKDTKYFEHNTRNIPNILCYQSAPGILRHCSKISKIIFKHDVESGADWWYTSGIRNYRFKENDEWKINTEIYNLLRNKSYIYYEPEERYTTRLSIQHQRKHMSYIPYYLQ